MQPPRSISSARWLVVIGVWFLTSSARCRQIHEEFPHRRDDGNEYRYYDDLYDYYPALPSDQSPESELDRNVANEHIPEEHAAEGRVAGSTVPEKRCDIYPYDPESADRVSSLLREGAKLIQYKLHFQDYPPESDPLSGNFSRNYKLDRWQRVTSRHGSMLLSLTFNFDVLSLWMLTFDVEELEVGLVDSHNCMQHLNEEQRFRTVRDLLMNDFEVLNGAGDRATPLGDGHALCHRIIARDDGGGRAEFKYECCHRDSGGKTVCHSDVQSRWVGMMYGILAAIKVLIVLFGPMMVQRWILTEPINKVDYVVPLRPEDNLKKTMLVKKVVVEDDSFMSSPNQQREIKQFRKFRRLVKDIPSDEIVSVKFHKLHILVDHRKLMSEKVVPFGVFHYIYEKILRCGLCSVEPFASCCQESVIGTWGPRFLWFKMFEKSDCNVSCRRYVSWGRIARIVGHLLVMAVMPLPYIVRIVCFYTHEEAEIEDRKEVLERLDLSRQTSHNLFQYLTPTHEALITMYFVYVASFLFLSCVRQCDKNSCDDHICGAVQDMRGISYLECLRMFLAHLILPFEKFGICGVLIGILYWPFALPVCFLVLVCYCVPTLYLSGRLLLHGRPSCLRLCPTKSPPTINQRQKSLSAGASSFESCLFLNNINPTGPQIESPSKRPDGGQSVCGLSKQSLSQATYTLLVGSLAILQMYSLLLMYAESIGFFVEVCMMSLLGAVVNATSTIRYAFLAFWILLYCAYCYRSVQRRYGKLNRKLFRFIKDGMYDQLQRCVTMRHEQRKNTALKYLSLSDIRQKERNATIYFDSEEDLPSVRPKERSSKLPRNQFVDTIDYQHGHLQWTIHGLVLFVDRRDTPRIPRDLFQKICQLEAPGCPGPIHKTLGRAVKQLALIVIFLLLMFVLMMILEEVSPISTAAELLLTLATGFLPLIFLVVLRDPEDEISLNRYSFTGKVQQVIMAYKETWPVFDLSFTRDFSAGSEPVVEDEDTTPPSQASTLLVRRHQEVHDPDNSNAGPDVVDPTHVDLLITVKDESELDCITGNLRSEPCSIGSHGSLNSGHRNSPDDPGPGHGGASSAAGGPSATNTNKPTNATAPRTAPENPATKSNHAEPGSDQASPPRVDLVVDIVKGGLPICGGQADSCKNGIPMWSVASSKYPAANDRQPESAL
ncbi:hypothetical protein LSH36_912g00060 [Paralvinella palmiformis]|uniref:Uncharacterized protein n=1 Tax=Paralvinella palmiformis TaxID=53620 RepID=A0AAD9MT23_9ANNE|nr:hypothetical protein LSH36_912g00060 [Paralvinella palmiformis]